ncbi:MAG: hypothetical protein HGA19_07280 [Oscillochloris sp.]|nr:hypothetical protein [Oscillochloris sp.]
MTRTQNITENSPSSSPSHAYLIVTLQPDGRYCVAYTDGRISRLSYTPSLEQVIRQAQRAGGLPIRTDDAKLRQRCLDAALSLI